jgi:hypothetical protein
MPRSFSKGFLFFFFFNFFSSFSFRNISTEKFQPEKRRIKFLVWTKKYVQILAFLLADLSRNF